MKARAFIALAGLVVTSVFFIDLCNAVFACGCQSLWAGADAHCNVHHAAVQPCPVCNSGMLGYALVFLGTAGPQMALALRLKSGHWVLRFLIVLLSFPLIGGLLMMAIRTVVFKRVLL